MVDRITKGFISSPVGFWLVLWGRNTSFDYSKIHDLRKTFWNKSKVDPAGIEPEPSGFRTWARSPLHHWNSRYVNIFFGVLTRLFFWLEKLFSHKNSLAHINLLFETYHRMLNKSFFQHCGCWRSSLFIINRYECDKFDSILLVDMSLWEENSAIVGIYIWHWTYMH